MYCLMKTNEKVSDNFWHRKLTLKVKFWSNFGTFDTSPLIQFSKFNNFLWVCWFLSKNLSNFAPPAWKLDNLYYHNLSNYSNLSKYNYIKVDMNHFYLPWPSFWPMKICLRKYMRILTSKARSCCSACAKVVTLCFGFLSFEMNHVTQLTRI